MIYIKIIKKNKYIFIFLKNKIFFKQKILKSNNINLSNSLYTFFYIILILYRFGFISYNNFKRIN